MRRRRTAAWRRAAAAGGRNGPALPARAAWYLTLTSASTPGSLAVAGRTDGEAGAGHLPEAGGPQAAGQPGEALGRQGHQHHVGVLGDELAQDLDQLVVVAMLRLGALGVGQQRVQALHLQLPLFLLTWGRLLEKYK